MIEAWQTAGRLGAFEVAFADVLARRGAAGDPRMRLAAALACAAPAQGHVCARLDRVGAVLGDPELPVPPLAEWLDVLRRIPSVVRGPAEDRVTPLVLDGSALYLDRPWENQRALVAAVRSRATAPGLAVDPVALRAGLAALFTGDPREERQRLAAATAVLRPLTVITGGPGTGKTAVVARVLALLHHLARVADRPPPRVAMVAPTGKAAARLSESVRDRLADLPSALALGIPTESSTIHRALGIHPTRRTARHDADNPLPVDVVVVDEASMVDLPLMARVLAAVPASARLVLLGDADQLVSVEMGAVLGEIVAAAGGPRSQPHARALGAVGVPVAGASGAAPTLADAHVRLEHTFRYAPDSAIRRLAEAIHGGDAEAAVAVLASGGARWIREASEAALRPLLVAAYAPVGAARTPSQALDALAAWRVLCAHRAGWWGVDGLNRGIERWLADEGCIAPGEVWYPGRPVMVTRNDPRLRLYNGDVGVVLDDAGARRTWFHGPEGQRSFAAGALPDHETVYATTVHKAQGSEHAHVVVILPDQPSPIVTRELLYTAVTRAKDTVTMVGSEDVIRHAVHTRVERMSGIAEHLTAYSASRNTT